MPPEIADDERVVERRTSSFSPSASETVEKLGKRIVLIDGKELAQLMIRHNVGCKIEETLFVKRSMRISLSERGLSNSATCSEHGASGH